MKPCFRLLLLAALWLVGCAPGNFAPEATAAPTMLPTPTPAPLVAVCAQGEDDGFLDAVGAVLKSAAVRLLPLAEKELADWEPEGRAALILRLQGNSAVPALPEGVLLYVYAPGGQTVPEGQRALRYDDAGAAAMALEEAARYEHHDTPVRLLGLMEQKESAAGEAWRAAIAEGRVFNKGAYYADETETDAGKWLSSRLDALKAGMLDGIFCESAALGRMAAEALGVRARDDCEVFCADANAVLLAFMQEPRTRLKRAIGPDPVRAGRLCTEQALVLLYGGEAQDLTIRPTVFAGG